MIVIEFDETVPDTDLVTGSAAPVEIVNQAPVTEVVHLSNDTVVETEPHDTVIVVDAPPAIEVVARTADTVIVTGGKGERGPAGPAGPPGPAGGTYAFEQVEPAGTWFVTHELGFHPHVTVFDSAGSEVVGEITHLDANALLITFTSSFGGFAYLS